MKLNCRVNIKRAGHLLALLIAGSLAGCGGTVVPPQLPTSPIERADIRLRAGDQVTIRLDTGGGQPPQAIDVVIDENGDVVLPLVGRIHAAGFSPAGLGEHIQANYVPRFYVRCTATVLTTVRFFYIGGEVRSPGRVNWTDDMTLMKAINTAGGFNDFANRRKVEVARGKEKQVYDAEAIRQRPEKDIAIQPGDSLYVPRSFF